MHSGERLRELRKGKGLTQRGLASQADLYFTTISKIEKGERKLTFDEAVRVAEVLGANLYDLAGVPSPHADAVRDLRSPLRLASSTLRGLADDFDALAVY